MRSQPQNNLEVMPPVIGLTTYGHQEKRTVSQLYEDHYSIPKEYVDSVIRAAGLPILIPPIMTDWQALWSALDGIVIVGGADVSPIYYGGDANSSKSQACAPERDAAEFSLLRYAAESKDKAVLCIRRGMQAMNVMLGGTLHAHIPDLMPSDMHSDGQGNWTMHDCNIVAGSILESIVGEPVVTTYSEHHQAIDRPADGLQVVATASDGIVEAIAAIDHPWFIGVQWHPEKASAEDPTQQRIFDEFVRASYSLARASRE